jgi:hypothetical protein
LRRRGRNEEGVAREGRRSREAYGALGALEFIEGAAWLGDDEVDERGAQDHGHRDFADHRGFMRVVAVECSSMIARDLGSVRPSGDELSASSRNVGDGATMSALDTLSS